MAIPDFQKLMLPILKVAGDGQEKRIGDVINLLANEFGLTEEERRQLLPSGKGKSFANRANWAKTYLVQAGLLEATKRAHFKITERGRKALAGGLPRIDIDYLSQFSEFIQFRERGRISNDSETTSPIDAVKVPIPAQTPDEFFEAL